MTLPDIPNFASLFQFAQRISTLEIKMSKFKQTNQFIEAVSLILSIVDNDLTFKMKEAMDVINQSLLEFELKKILIDKIEENRSINRSDIQKNLYNALVESYNFDKDIITSYGDVVTLKRGKYAYAEEHGQKVDDLEDQTHQEFNIGNDDVTHSVDNRPPQPWITQMAQAAGTQSSFNEFLATPIDFSTFIMHWLKIDTMTQEVLTGPTYDLLKGTCKSVVELEYHLEEVFKATNDQLEWYNPEGKPYPHELSKPLLLIRMNESQIKVVYNKHAYWGTYHWGLKRQKFYEYASNMEISKDVYLRHKIIVVTSLKIMKYFGYSHLEEIIVRRQDDQLYKFRECDFKRLRRQDIKDIWIVIQERIEDLKLGVESYQKKINLTRLDTYRSDLKRMTPCTSYPNMQGLIYKDEINKNCLMRTDKLHQFNDGTLNHVRTALNDIATWIEMDYFPKRK
nr:hypothetical protein [Tanacetum cinerariifolium]